MENEKKIKLNIGSHSKIVKGDYINVDVLDLPNVDIVCDITKIPWVGKVKDDSIWVPSYDSVDEILMVEVLEHISFRDTDKVLAECYRVLKPGGSMQIQVPDTGAMMEAYVFGTISAEVPHKPKEAQDVFNKMMENKTVHPDRWLYAFTGAQKHRYDAHLNIFTKERMQEYLENAGFSKIDIQSDKFNWKIIAKVIK